MKVKTFEKIITSNFFIKRFAKFCEEHMDEIERRSMKNEYPNMWRFICKLITDTNQLKVALSVIAQYSIDNDKILKFTDIWFVNDRLYVRTLQPGKWIGSHGDDYEGLKIALYKKFGKEIQLEIMEDYGFHSYYENEITKLINE